MARSSLTSTLFTTIAVQWAVVAGCGLLAWVVAGAGSGWSCAAGGAAVAGPNAVLAAYLWLKSRQIRVLSAASFLAGELIKLVGTVAAIYFAAHWLGPRVVWLALVLGVIAALKGQWLAVWFTRDL